MEIYECEEAVHEALKQPRPKRIVTMINKVQIDHDWLLDVWTALTVMITASG